MPITVARFRPGWIALLRRVVLASKAAPVPLRGGAIGLIARIYPAQHFLKMVLDGFVAEAGPDSQRLAVAHQDRAAAGLQDPFRLECLDHAADITAANPQHGRKLLMRERHGVGVISTLHRRDDPFRRALLDRMDRIAGRRLED